MDALGRTRLWKGIERWSTGDWLFAGGAFSSEATSKSLVLGIMIILEREEGEVEWISPHLLTCLRVSSVAPWFFNGSSNRGSEGVVHSAELWSKPFIIISNISVYVDILLCISSCPLLMIGFSYPEMMFLVYDDIFRKSERVDLLITLHSTNVGVR